AGAVAGGAHGAIEPAQHAAAIYKPRRADVTRQYDVRPRKRTFRHVRLNPERSKGAAEKARVLTGILVDRVVADDFRQRGKGGQPARGRPKATQQRAEMRMIVGIRPDALGIARRVGLR